MLRRRSKNNPQGARKLRAPGIIVQKAKVADNWSILQLSLRPLPRAPKSPGRDTQLFPEPAMRGLAAQSLDATP